MNRVALYDLAVGQEGAIVLNEECPVGGVVHIGLVHAHKKQFSTRDAELVCRAGKGRRHEVDGTVSCTTRRGWSTTDAGLPRRPWPTTRHPFRLRGCPDLPHPAGRLWRDARHPPGLTCSVISSYGALRVRASHPTSQSPLRGVVDVPPLCLSHPLVRLRSTEACPARPGTQDGCDDLLASFPSPAPSTPRVRLSERWLSNWPRKLNTMLS